jgi:hypothetical protein
MKLTKALGLAGALLLSALVGGTLIGSALATDEETGTDDATDTAYCDTFRDALASELGVTVDDLAAAGKAAALTTVDAAVAAGDLDDDRAATLRERIAAWDGTDCRGFGRGFALGAGRGFEYGFERGFGRGLVRAAFLETAAETIGIDVADLHEQLANGATLQDIAGDSYETVKAAVLAEVESTLDERVADGLDQERAEEILERVTTWLDEGGTVPAPGAGRGPGVGGGHRHGQGHGPGGIWSDDDAEESGT